MNIVERTTEDALGPLNDHETKHAPDRLYMQGDESLLWSAPRVSIVGSRNASGAGLKRAASLSRLLARRGVTVVSGLATGIDTASHCAAIDAGGRTIGVIGTPLDKYYPKENRRLQDLIAAEHLLVSQFQCGAAVRPGNFPSRNKTMALISNATVIVEATDKSGTLHQGWEALRLGRQLYILESAAEDATLEWPKKFLDYGAQVLRRDGIATLVDLLPSRLQFDGFSLLV